MLVQRTVRGQSIGRVLGTIHGLSTGISEYRVTAICVTLGGLFLEWEIKRGFAGRSAIGIIPDWIGKTVFLTRAEAETALQQTEGENGIENSKSYPEKDELDGTLRQ